MDKIIIAILARLVVIAIPWCILICFGYIDYFPDSISSKLKSISFLNWIVLVIGIRACLVSIQIRDKK